MEQKWERVGWPLIPPRHERDDEIRAIKKQSATSKEGEGRDTETEAGERQDLGLFNWTNKGGAVELLRIWFGSPY